MALQEKALALARQDPDCEERYRLNMDFIERSMPALEPALTINGLTYA